MTKGRKQPKSEAQDVGRPLPDVGGDPATREPVPMADSRDAIREAEKDQAALTARMDNLRSYLKHIGYPLEESPLCLAPGGDASAAKLTEAHDWAELEEIWGAKEPIREGDPRDRLWPFRLEKRARQYRFSWEEGMLDSVEEQKRLVSSARQAVAECGKDVVFLAGEYPPADGFVKWLYERGYRIADVIRFAVALAADLGKDGERFAEIKRELSGKPDDPDEGKRLSILADRLEELGCQVDARARAKKPTPAAKNRAARKTSVDEANGKMLNYIQKHPDEAPGMKARDWAQEIGCSPSTVTKTRVWKETLPRLKEKGGRNRHLRLREDDGAIHPPERED